VVTPTDIEAAHPYIYPFTSPRALDPFQDHRNEYHPLPEDKFIFSPKDPYTTEIPEEALKIDHIFVWNDPRDWSLDIQVINDALASHKGYLGTLSRKNGDKSLPNNGWQQDGQPSLWISNMDLHWKTQHHINRFGTGAFIEALKGVWKAATDGAELQYNALGKPLQVTYEYAHDKLLHMHERGKPGEKRPLRTVYMIGDNPESDIQGGNNFNPEDDTEWKSILVRTGVWNPTEAEPEPRHKPDMIANDVVDAIVWALNTEGVKISRDELLKLGHRDASLSPEQLEQQERERADKEAATLLGTRDRHHRLSALMR
jgi:ribonucleotide monophosphatase NagD (HAD superfamily)